MFTTSMRASYGLLALITLSLCVAGFGALIPTDLKCEYRIDPIGIDNPTPRLSWKLIDPENARGQTQSGYQILVASSIDKLKANRGDLWDSGAKEDSESLHRVYAGAPLKSGQQCYWKVRIKDSAGVLSDWSQPAKFTVGLLDAKDWKGQWIHKKDQQMTDHNWFRKNLTLKEAPESALVYLGSFGYHELYVNGQKIGDGVMNPVLSFMKKRLPYLTYDIAEYLKPGDNVIAVWHAAGWARWPRVNEYRKPPFAFKAQIVIKDGSETKTLVSDRSWKCAKSHSEYIGPWDILDFGGERIDARRQVPDWNTADFDDAKWDSAEVWKGRIPATLSAQMVEPQVMFQKITPKSVSKNDDGTYLIDMSRNYTGYFEIKLRNGTAGQMLTFEIANRIEPGKPSCYGQKSEYIYDETGEGTFTNRFNIAGGRWVTVTGLNYQPELEDIVGYVITNDRKQISQFESSSELLNRIYQINLDTYLANTLDGILMDCPHRERRGWGEVTVAAMYGDALPNFESGAYMDQYLQYQRDAQFDDGQIRAIVNEQDRPFFMWKANSPITVWASYRMLGDIKILKDNYDSMERWMTWLLEHSNYETGGSLIIGEQGKREFPGLGDWCTPKGNFWDSANSPEANHFNNCLYAYMLDYAEQIATTLGKQDDAAKYADRLAVQRKAIHKEFYDPATGDYGNGQQVNQAFALIAGVPPESEKQKVYDRLVDEVLYEFPYYDTGSSGQALYTRYFTEYGERMDLIYGLLEDEAHPSYGYFLAQDETTWPERWSSTGGSRIHTCYTGIGGYFIKGFGGIRPDPEKPGMRHFLIKPTPVGDLTFADTEFESGYGKIVSNWKRSAETASFHIEVPVNTFAKIYLPAVGKEHVKEGEQLAESAEGVRFLGTETSDAVGNYVIYGVGSGSYDFTVSAIPEVSYPEPMNQDPNLAKVARMSASSMHIASEKEPGFEAFKTNDENPETSWRAASANGQWLEAAWVKPRTINAVTISEVGNQITTFQLQIWKKNKWLDLVTGDTCGPELKHSFDSVTATKCRLLFSGASKAPEISEFVISRN
jgi:alpha-L-rhamnosidase